MPRLSQARPKYRKHKASGQAVVTLNGRDHYLGPYGSRASRTLYDRLTSEWILNGRSLQPLGAASISVVELCARFLEHARGYYVKDGRPTGAIAGFKAVIKYLRVWYGRDPAANFGPLALKALRQRMVDDGHSRRYVNDHVARIKQIFKWGVSEELVPGETHAALQRVTGLLRGRTTARETSPIGPVDDAVVEATLPHLPEVVADMVRLQRHTGMRPAEVCILRPCGVDRSGEVWLYRPSSHKTEHHGRERVVFLGPEAQSVLLRYLARDGANYSFQPRDSEAKRRAAASAARKTPLHYGNRPGTNRRARPKVRPGERYNTCSYRKAIGRACDTRFPIQHSAIELRLN
jgi:integrase